MVAYNKDEIVGITEFSRSLNSFIEKVKNSTVEKLAIMKNNKPNVVIIPVSEYERMKAASDYLENLEIAKIIEERVINRKEPAEMLTIEQLKENLRKRDIDV